ncbi:MAG TPA: DUF1178 family protein [Acidiferrobacteraceae bacterium]|nr:DUF1178 family protein [Acidiferrobacteraceae bacterium]
MIIYDLCCDAAHQFEGWFGDVDDYEQQRSSGLLSCPVCGNGGVRRLPTASHVKTSGRELEKITSTKGLNLPESSAEFARELHHYVETNYDNVGVEFSEEARRIHHGHAEERNIYGSATPEQVSALREEGIHTLSLPIKPPAKDKLN